MPVRKEDSYAHVLPKCSSRTILNFMSFSLMLQEQWHQPGVKSLTCWGPVILGAMHSTLTAG